MRTTSVRGSGRLARVVNAQVVFTQTEWAGLKVTADEAGLSVSTYARERLMSATPLMNGQK